MKTIADRSVRYVSRAEFNVKTEPPRAGWTELAGRIWPAGRTLPTPALEGVDKTLYITLVHMLREEINVSESMSVCLQIRVHSPRGCLPITFEDTLLLPLPKNPILRSARASV